MSGHAPTDDDLARRFAALWEGVQAGDGASVDALAPLYAEHMVFQDPIQTIRGRNDFLADMRRLVLGSRELTFRIDSGVRQGDALFATWTMHLQLKLGPRLTIEGATHARMVDGVVVSHRDYWDVLQSVMGSVPLAGAVYRSVVGLLGRA